LMSGDKNFRPSDIVFGEDGALYFSDWHNVIIGHMQHNVRDPNRDHLHGRIYRMTYPSRPLQKPVAIDGQPIAALLDNLKHPTDSVRQRTRVELSERPTDEVIAAVKEWVKQFDPNKKEDAHALIEALWVYQQHNVRNVELLGQLLKSPEPHARIAATTAQHLWFNVESTMHGGVIGGELTESTEKSGILSDTPELTTIRVGTIPERMRYDVTELTVKPGKRVKLTFANPDFMPHNILLVKPGTDNDIGLKAMALGAGGFAVNYVPASPDILWSSKLVDHGQEEVIEFTAPTEEGAYPYICSFPGHHLLMRGMMYVTNDLKDFLVRNPKPVVKITEWKLADLQEDVKRAGQHRNFLQGQLLFTKLACAQCHKMTGADAIPAAIHDHASAGHSHGPSLTVGPDLAEVVKKYKNDPKLVLQEIVEPSRNIEEKYRKFMFEMDSGKYVIGNIVSEDKESVTVQTGPTADQQQKIVKKEIESRRPSPVSIMPAGLLNTLDKEQILDLVAYLIATGRADHEAFKP
ncbi:MAG: c-type cytochrome, partial [Planctomycetaceae bacterium]|nr:c-type cytochrome [Planctomycetaceae bacterium]